MTTTDIRFRAAEARDAARAVPLIYSAGPEGFDYVFRQGNTSALDYLHYAFPDGRGLFGFRNHTVAEVDGTVVGIGAFYSGVEYNALSNGTALQVLAFYGLRCLPILKRGFETKQWMLPPRRRMLYVANLGVAPEMRSRGVGAALLRSQMQNARGQGKELFALDVAATNPAAQRLYERLGLRVTGETAFIGTRLGIIVPTARRMELEL